jgi:hypothetical protein
MREAEPQVIPAASDNGPMTAHWACPVCEPVGQLGMKAVCGEKLLGLPALTGQGCSRCSALVDSHLREHGL